MKDEIISKELLSEVLYFRIRIINKLEDNKLYYDDIFEINIHELAHKCKEWAFKKGLFSWDLQYDEDYYYLIVKLFNGKFYQALNFSEEDIIKQEFKACQWILENKKDKDD